MASLPVGQNHHMRTLLADDLRDLQAVFPRVFDTAVRNIQGLSEADLENLRSLHGFSSAVVGCAARAHLTFSEIENPRPPSALGHLEQRTAAGLLHVVAMRGDG